jgi:hemolysin III
VAALAAAPVGGWLVTASPPGRVRVATVVYAVTLTAMFAVSALYHRRRWTGRARRRMKAADHVAIFCFIAGSYGPLDTLTLSPPAAAGWLGALWLGAIGGSVVKLRLLDRLGGPADVCYGVLTWSGLLILPALASRLGAADLGLLLGGLAVYSLAAAVLGRRRPDPWPRTFGYHEVAHALTVAAAACHVVLYARLFR